MHCVCIAWKCAALHDDLGALAFGAPETHHHEMEIDGQRIHHHHFAGACANQARTEFAELLVEINPRAAREHVPLNGKSRPVIQFLLHHHARGARHETQGIATQVSERPTVFTEWMFKFRAH